MKKNHKFINHGALIYGIEKFLTARTEKNDSELAFSNKAFLVFKSFAEDCLKYTCMLTRQKCSENRNQLLNFELGVQNGTRYFCTCVQSIENK